MYCSPIKYFNDPFDCRLEFRKEYSDKERQIYLTKAFLRNGQSIDAINIEGILQTFTNEDLLKLFNQNTKVLIV